ncbi:MAG TPA: sugar phosphate nucleotidyltransferase [Micromonosporaceae bacterium]|nr:sugar phosphate nucleotidyltransferase [Micromonosporaceae bacterium]
MTFDGCAVVLAAGEGRRLRPLTTVRPKPLCPVGNIALLDSAMDRISRLGPAGPDRLAVNACHLAEQIVAHVGGRAHLSVEPGSPLGTAGGVAGLREWIDGRAVLVANADAYLADPDLSALLDGWDGSTVRLLGVPAAGLPPEFGGYRFAGVSLLPWSDVRALPGGRGELVATTWRPAERAGRLEVVPYHGAYLDTGTPRDYLAANLHAAQGARFATSGAGWMITFSGDWNLVAPDATVTGQLHGAVVGAGATVAGTVTRGVVWPGGRVAADEHLVDAVRVGADLTVTAGRPHPVDSMSDIGPADRQEHPR